MLASLRICARRTSNLIRGLHTKVCIIGSGPGAHSAAIYASRGALEPILVEGNVSNFPPPGGQLTTTIDVENYAGFPDSVGGFELMQLMKQQSEKFGTRILTEEVESVDFTKPPYKLKTEHSDISADSVIVATGAVARRLDFIGADEYWNRGISACATCDGALPMFRDENIVVVGGGDSAMEEALFLTKFAKQVFVVHRRDELRASQIMQKRARWNPKITFILSHVVERAVGDGRRLNSLVLKSTKSGNEESVLETKGLFFAVGHVPATKFLQGSGLDLDNDGYVITLNSQTTTNLPGVFACGDVADRVYRQAITAAGTGCMAALDAERYLESSS
ncbi:hypothetical protein NDN08_002292 [Rhodosorus marinus]|uniref:Thioredoxin reductase n=1 Tax=Rhodosorus marinus TaxID=101924 RepID=A0AAV8UXQ1_9RHOD|nr:hypothetical protein NDN08_002292 [Rhodosorus marinus]